jgi:uncharacterized protein (DUF58 family)
MNGWGTAGSELLRRAELAVSRRVHGLRQGDHLALLPGHGVEAGEARIYVPGDDVRRIDWTVTARTGTPHVRDAVAERELDVLVLVDLSGSLDFGTAGGRKSDLALEVLGAVGSLASRGHDRLGAVLLGGRGLEVVPARAGRSHLIALLARAAGTPVSGATDLPVGLETIGGLARRRGLVVVMSDFLGQTAWEASLRRLARRHDVIAIELVDPREQRLPDVGFLTVVDAESGQRRTIDTGRVEVRAAYAARADERATATARAITNAGADHVRLTTGSDWVGPFVHFLDTRRRDRLHGRRGSAWSTAGAIR